MTYMIECFFCSLSVMFLGATAASVLQYGSFFSTLIERKTAWFSTRWIMVHLYVECLIIYQTNTKRLFMRLGFTRD